MNLLFAHDKIRPQQDLMVKGIISSLENRQHSLIHAPTGVGKTAASLSSALSYALTKNLKIIFVTPKHTQHRIAVDTIKQISKKHNLSLNVVDLLGKKAMCIQSGVEKLSSGEFSEYCSYLTERKQCEYHLRIKENNKLTLEAKSFLSISGQEILHAEELIRLCRKAGLCPYNMAAELGKKAHIIIADYFHIINPSIRKHILTNMSKEIEKMIVVIDEAHNLPEKAREIMSTTISTFVINSAIREASALGFDDAAQDLKEVRQVLESLAQTKMTIEQEEALIQKDSIVLNFDYDKLMDELEEIAEETRETKNKSFCGAVVGFFDKWWGEDEGFARILKKGFDKRGKPSVAVSYNCLDPSFVLKGLFEKSYAVIGMSGTFTPLKMYKDLFGIEADLLELKNPFPTGNKLSIIIPETTTKFTMRSEDMYQKIAGYCTRIVNAVPGNSIVFFPSYFIRDKIAGMVSKSSSKTVFLESSGMSKQERDEMLDRFKSYKSTGATLLAVSTGSFGEGVDLKGDYLKCVVIIGLPLAKPDLETTELIKYYDLRFGKGWEYAYTLPAIKKCLQNAGRCIRSETDRGIIVFLDERYLWDSYQKCFPKGENMQICSEPEDKIREFFNQI